jgi:hypothetical protein
MMKKTLFACLLAALLAGCAVYDYPAQYAPVSALERSWYATLGAMRDQKLEIETEDRVHGRIEGRRDGHRVVARVSTNAEGRVRVEFSSPAKTPEDTELAERVSRSYDARMKR